MLLWLCLTLAATASFAASIRPRDTNQPGNGPQHCRGRAWVRAPDMVPGEIITGDVKVRLIGQCAEVEKYTLGLHFKEKVFWKLRTTHSPDCTDNRVSNKAEWTTYCDKGSWSVHEEERTAFEIETDLVNEEREDSLPTDFVARFGILVPNTNYPPGIDYRDNMWLIYEGDDKVWTESVYEYFVKVQFNNGTTSKIPAGITAFAPFYLPTKKEVHENVSLAADPDSDLEPDLFKLLYSNYTVDVSFPDGAYFHEDSLANFTVIVRRTGYTNQTDKPIQLCADVEQGDIEWNPRELKGRTPQYMRYISALVPSTSRARSPKTHPLPCQTVNFPATATNLTQEGHISSTSSEPFSLSFYVRPGHIPDFSTYYLKLGNRLSLDLRIELGSSDSWMAECEKQHWEREREEWEKQAAEIDFDWVPWSPQSPNIPSTPDMSHIEYLYGQIDIPVVPIQREGPVRSTPVHYLSAEARCPSFFNLSDIDSLRLMTAEELDLIAPLAQPSIKVFGDVEDLGGRYFADFDMQKPIYVGDTWANKVLPSIVRGHRTDTLGQLLIVQ